MLTPPPRLVAKLPLRWVLVLPFVLQTMGAMALVGYLSYRNGQQVVTTLSQRLMNEVGDRIVHHLTDYYEAPRQQVRENQAAIELGLLNWQNLPLVEAYFVQQLALHPSLSGLMITTERQDFLAVERSGNRQFSIRQGDRSAGTQEIDTVTLEGRRLSRTDGSPNDTPDTVVASEPWYEAAKLSSNGLWRPVVARVQGSNRPSLMMAYFLPFTNAQGRVQGILSASAPVEQVGQFLRSLQIGSTGQAFIMDERGFLIATSTPETPFRQNLSPAQPPLEPGDLMLPAWDSQNPVTRAAATWSFNQPVRHSVTHVPTAFRLDQQQYFAQVRPFSLDPQTQWTIVVVIPESDFAAEIQASQVRTVLFSGLALLGAIASALWIAQRISRSLSRLTQSARSVAAGTLDTPLPTSRVAEVQDVTDSFRSMVLEIQQANQLRQNYAQELERQVAEQTRALKARETELRLITDSVPGGIAYIDASVCYRFVNHTYEVWFDCRKEDLLGRSIQEVIGVEAYQHVRQYVERVLAGETVTYEAEVPYQGNKTRYISAVLLPDVDEHSTVQGYYALITDISDRKKLELALQTSEATLSEVLNSANASIASFRLHPDRQWQYEYRSEGCENVFGYTAQDLMADPHLWISRIFPEDLEQKRVANLDSFMTNYPTTIQGEYRFFHKDGRLRWATYQATTRPVAAGGWQVTVIDTDITSRKRLELALQTSEAKLRDILNSAIAAITSFRVFPEGTWEYSYRSKGAEGLFGYTAEEFMRDPLLWESRVPPEDQEMASVANLLEDIFAERTFTFEYRFLRKDRSLRWISNVFTSRRDPTANCWIVTGIGTDITDLKQVEQELRQRDEVLQQFNRNLEALVEERTDQLNLAIATARMGIWQRQMQKDENGQYRISDRQYWSPKNYALLGFKTDNTGRVLDQDGTEISPYPTYALFLNLIHPDDREHIERLVQAIEQQQLSTYEQEYRVVWRDGTVRWHLTRGSVLRDDQGQVVRRMGVTLDITERKQAEEQVQNSLHEKEVLLREIHHRVKNNLQIICSLIRLQVDQIENAQTAELLRETQDRIQSMALIHELLYESPNLAAIDVREYIHTLMKQLFRSYGAAQQGIVFHIDIDEIYLDIDRAIPCGLVVNELVSNALKHAFPEGRQGAIGVEIRKGDRPNQIQLVVKDDGVGLPAYLDWSNATTLGFQIILGLVNQLRGQMTASASPENSTMRPPGTQFTITFTF